MRWIDPHKISSPDCGGSISLDAIGEVDVNIDLLTSDVFGLANGGDEF